MSRRQRLATLGIEVPLLPITAVGSYPKPAELTAARTRFVRGEISRGELRELEEQATAMWMGFQNEIGVDVAVDGEMYRGDMVAYFAEEMDGFERGGLVRSYGNRFYRKPIVIGEIRWREPITVEWWRLAQSMTGVPVKGMLTGGYTVMDWSFNEHYSNRRLTAIAFAEQLRHEVEALVEAGCRIVQIDEPALSVRRDELDVAVECMRICTEGIDAYFVTHACYGDFDTVFGELAGLPVDNFDLEMVNSGFDLLSAFERHGFDRDLSIGVVDPHTHVVESQDDVTELIRLALRALAPEQVWVDPDCGLKTRSVQQAQDKMRVVANATRVVRKEIEGA